jgi:hypothetical protein
VWMPPQGPATPDRLWAVPAGQTMNRVRPSVQGGSDGTVGAMSRTAKSVAAPLTTTRDRVVNRQATVNLACASLGHRSTPVRRHG